MGKTGSGKVASRGDLSLREARRIALAAQGFDRRRPSGRVEARHIRRTIHQLGLLQIDYVNVVVPAHYQVLFSRLGPYRMSCLDELVFRRREFTEQWGHEASIVPVESWPLLRFRREAHRVRPNGFESFMKRHPDYVERVLDEIRARGPLAADDLPDPDGVSRRIESTWYGTVPRATLEAHFGKGVLAVAERRPNFARVFDLADRIIPPEHHRRKVGTEEAQRELVRIAARGRGVGTAADLADYFRMPVREARPRIQELVSSGELREVRVEGWSQPAYLHPQARLPGRMAPSSLLSPFDPVIWSRARVKRLFDFDYRFEIFVPQAKRKWGSYVLPFLLGDRLVARVDLKADRTASRLLVPAAYIEPDVKPGTVVDALATELQTMAAWLGLEAVVVGRRGDLSRRLAVALRT